MYNISYNYAKAIFNFSIENKIYLINWFKNIKEIRKIINKKKINEILRNTKNSKNIYKNLNLFFKINNKYEKNFIKILIENNKLFFLNNIINFLKIMICKMNHIKIIEIISPYKINKINKRNIKLKLKLKLFDNKNYKIKIKYKIKKKIISGIIIKHNNNIIDLSIYNKIKNLKKYINS